MYSFHLSQVVQSKSSLTTGILKLLAFLKLPLRARKAAVKPGSAFTAQVLHLVEAGQTVFKIGPHEASTLYFLAQKIGDTGQVIAFEHHPAMRTYLAEIRQLMRWTNVLIDPACIWNNRVENGGNASKKGERKGALVVPFNTRPRKELALSVVTLDQYCAVHGVYPDVLLIDAKGHELQILMGAGELLQVRKPRLLVTFDARKGGRENTGTLFRWLVTLGYEGSFMMNGKVFRLEEFDFDLQEVSGEDVSGTCFQFAASPRVNDLS